MDKSHVILDRNLNIFQILEQKYAKTEMAGGFDTYKSFKNDSGTDV